MSKKDRIKFSIDILKTVLITFLVALFGMLSFAFSKYKTLVLAEGIFLLIGVLADILIIALIVKNIFLKLNEIEKED